MPGKIKILLILFSILLIACVVREYKVEGVEGEVRTLASPTNKVLIIENGKSIFKDVGEVLDDNGVLRDIASWVKWTSGDSISANGFTFMGDGRYLVTDQAVLAWLLGILPDSLDIQADTLTITAIGDSIAIQGSNSLQVPFRVYGIDTLSDIYTKTFPSGSRIINRANGAQYLVQADSVSGYTTDSVAVIPTGGRFAVLQPQQGVYNATWFEAVGDGVTNNGDLFYRISRLADGKQKIFIPQGIFLYDSTIYFGKRGINMYGVGSNYATAQNASILKYTGTDAAIKNDPSLNVVDVSEPNRITLRDFGILGTDTATYGIEFDVINYPGVSGSISGAIVNNISIAGFTDTLAYAVKLYRVYASTFQNMYIENCGNGYLLGTESVQNRFVSNHLSSVVGYGYHQLYGMNIIEGGVIGGGSSPDDSQRGVYISGGPMIMQGVHLESNYRPIEAVGGQLMLFGNKFNASTAPALFHDAANVSMMGNYLPSNQSITAGLRTTWIGDINGTHTIPTISADNPNGFATITRLSGNFTLTTFSNVGVPDGLFTLIFTNDSVTVASRETSIPYIHLKDGIDFKGYTGDMLVLQKRENIGGTITLHEIARFRHNDNYMQNRSSDYTVLRGDHGLTFTNKGATDTVTFTLPSPGQFNDNMEYTFIKLDSDPMRIQTTGSPRKIRGGTATSYLELIDIGSSVTLRIDSLVYEIIHSNGLYRYSDPESGYAGGNLAGVSIGRIGDTLGLVSYELNRPLIGSGGTQHNTSAGIITNNSLTTNSKWLNINNTSDAQLYMGIGFEPNGFTGTIAHNPNVTAHLEEGRNTTGSALTLAGMRFDGTYASKTNLLNDTMGLVSINGYGWRGSSNRAAASIRISGAKNMGGTSYDGVIQFRTSSSGTFATRATIKRNGDFYLGDGLPEYDLSTPSAKIYIRSNSTTGSEYAMLVENSAETDLFSIRNGGEVNVGNLTDIGAYIMQITGNTYIDGSLTVTDSIILNGLSIISGTTAPAAGLGSQGSLYMRDDDDSTLYTKTGTGWVLLN